MSSHASRQDDATSPVTETLKQRIGRNVRRAREAAGMTQRELAVELDTDVMQISRWERGKTRPLAGNEALLAHVLFGGDVTRLYEDSWDGTDRRAS